MKKNNNKTTKMKYKTKSCYSGEPSDLIEKHLCLRCQNGP